MTPFVLGMSRRQLSAAAGEPSTVEHSSYGPGNAFELWLYAEHQVEVKFSQDLDWRLSSVSVASPSATIRGVRFIGQPASHLVALAASAGINDITPDGEFDEFGNCYQSSRFGLQFWEHEGQMVRVTLFPSFDESGNVPKWPEA